NVTDRDTSGLSSSTYGVIPEIVFCAWPWLGKLLLSSMLSTVEYVMVNGACTVAPVPFATIIIVIPAGCGRASIVNVSYFAAGMTFSAVAATHPCFVTDTTIFLSPSAPAG